VDSERHTIVIGTPLTDYSGFVWRDE